MWKLILLFVALTPGIAFTAPVKKAFRGVSPKVLIAAVHALIFIVILNFFRVSEGYQNTPMSIIDQLESIKKQLKEEESRINDALVVDTADFRKSNQILSDSRVQMALIDAQIKSMIKTIRENAVQLAKTKDAVTVASQTVSRARALFEADLREGSRIRQPLKELGPQLEYHKARVKKDNENIAAGSASIKAWSGSLSIANEQLKRAQTAASSAKNGSNRTLITSTARALETALAQVANYTDKYKNAGYNLTNAFSQLTDDKKILDQIQNVMDIIQKDIKNISAAIERDRIAITTAEKALISAQESMNALTKKAPIDEQNKKNLDGSYRVLDRDVKYYSAHISAVGKRISTNGEKLRDIKMRIFETSGKIQIAINAMVQNPIVNLPPTVDPGLPPTVGPGLPPTVDPSFHVDPIIEIDTVDLGSSLGSSTQTESGQALSLLSGLTYSPPQTVDLRDVLGTSGSGLTPQIGSGTNVGGGSFGDLPWNDPRWLQARKEEVGSTTSAPACGIQ